MNENYDRMINILDRCLSRIQSGQISLEDCLKEYPELKEDLMPLLEVANQFHSSLSPPSPGETFTSTTVTRLLNRLRSTQGSPIPIAKKETRWKWWIRRPAYALASIALVIGLLATSAGVAWASTDALPGDLLYGVKRGIEKTRLALSFSVAGDVNLLTQFAEERLSELEALLSADRETDAELALAGYENMIDQMIVLASQSSQTSSQPSMAHIQSRLAHHEEVLQRTLGKAPDETKKAIQKAIQKSNRGQEVVDYIRQGGDPRDLAPGQLKKSEDPSKKDDRLKSKDKKDRTPGPPPWVFPDLTATPTP
jgi:hypothetical protein